MSNRDDFSHYKVIDMIHVHCNFLHERLFNICKMFVLILYTPVNNLSVMFGLNQY